MISPNEIKALNEKFIAAKNEEALALLITIEQLQNEALGYKQNVLRKLTTIEEDMGRLIAENENQITLRESAYIERDSCVGLIAKLAVANGAKAGVVPGKPIVVVELSTGQVSWEFAETEDHLFEGLPEYSKPVEEMELMEKYRRVMNAEIHSK